MSIIKGSTPTIRIVLSDEQVSWDNLYKVYVTFAQKDLVLDTLSEDFIFEKTDGTHSNGTIVFSKKLTQTQTLSLKEDVDLDCQIDVLESLAGGGYDRKISKVYSLGVCKTLLNEEIPDEE